MKTLILSPGIFKDHNHTNTRNGEKISHPAVANLNITIETKFKLTFFLFRE